MYCQYCGKEIPNGAYVCPYCFRRVCNIPAPPAEDDQPYSPSDDMARRQRRQMEEMRNRAYGIGTNQPNQTPNATPTDKNIGAKKESVWMARVSLGCSLAVFVCFFISVLLLSDKNNFGVLILLTVFRGIFSVCGMAFAIAQKIRSGYKNRQYSRFVLLLSVVIFIINLNYSIFTLLS